jgi:hypothetical protein
MQDNGVQNAEHGSYRSDSDCQGCNCDEVSAPGATQRPRFVAHILPPASPELNPFLPFLPRLAPKLATGTHSGNIAELPSGLLARSVRSPSFRDQFLRLRFEVEVNLILYISGNIRSEQS